MSADVLILGSAQYSDRSWVNCQQVASRLAGANRVLFVDSIGVRDPRPSGGDLTRILRRLRDAVQGLKRAPDGVWVLSPVVRNGAPLEAAIRAALGRLKMRPDAVLAYLPTWAPVVAGFPDARRAYHCVDAYAENPGVDRARIERLEGELLASVDLVMAVSPPLRARLAARHPNVVLLPNVADVERFEAAAGGPAPREAAAIPRPRLLYLGNLAAYKIDLARIERLARARPAWSWMLVGPAGRGDPRTDLRPLRALPNVHLLGEKPREAAPRYVAAADVCLLPLREGDSTRHSSPLKVCEYLASGHPIVATPIPAIEGWIAAGLVRGARTDAEWLAAVEAALDDGDRDADARQRGARRCGWGERIVQIARMIGATPP